MRAEWSRYYMARSRGLDAFEISTFADTHWYLAVSQRIRSVDGWTQTRTDAVG